MAHLLSLRSPIVACMRTARHEDEKLLADCREAVARHFAIPPHLAARGGQRCVVLWRLVAISTVDAGRELRIVPLERDAPVPPRAADLSSPIGADTWPIAFLPVIANACYRHGVEPRAARGALGRWIEDSLTRSFTGKVDFESLRRTVLDYLAPDRDALALAHAAFGPQATAAQFNWIAANAAAVASGRVIPFPRAWR